MKNKIRNKKSIKSNNFYHKTFFITLLSLIFFIWLSSIVSAGVTNPLPSNIELTSGESGRFKFQIQATQSESDLNCNFNFQNQPPFKVEFDQDMVLVKGKSVQDIYGTITTSGLDIGNYKSEFCVVCDPLQKQAGASVKIDTCGLLLNVNIVPIRTRDNLYVPPQSNSMGWIVFGIIIIIIIVLVIIIIKLLLKRRNSFQKETLNQLNTTEKSVAASVAPQQVNRTVKGQKAKNIK
mgnify:FL=1